MGRNRSPTERATSVAADQDGGGLKRPLICPRAVSGAGDFGEELAELGAIFFAGAGFDAAGDVDGVGADGEDGFGHVFGGEAAGEDDAVSFCGAAGEVQSAVVPVPPNWSLRGVEQEC